MGQTEIAHEKAVDKGIAPAYIEHVHVSHVSNLHGSGFMVNRLRIAERTNGRRFLSGLVGRQIYPHLVAAIEKQKEPSPIFLDFSDVTVSGSFYSQAVLPLRNFGRRMNAYIVLSNLDEDSQEELAWLLETASDAVYVCELDDDEEVKNPRWIGNLDAKQRLTFLAALSEQEVDASQLAEKFPMEDIRVTGWNNRLSALNKKGLLMEIRNGRSKRYRPVIQIGT